MTAVLTTVLRIHYWLLFQMEIIRSAEELTEDDEDFSVARGTLFRL